MVGSRSILAAVLSATLASLPVCGAPATSLGTVITADHAYVGTAPAEIGTTLYGGDRLHTESQGSVQLRAGAARLLLQSASVAVVDDTDGAPSARLFEGSAKFSTGNAQAFTLFAATAVVRAQSDAPTIAQVTFLNPKELLVAAQRSAVVVSVGDDTQVVPEGTAYRVLLDSQPEAAGLGGQRGTLKAGRSRFIIVAGVIIAGVTTFAIIKALESPDRP